MRTFEPADCSCHPIQASSRGLNSSRFNANSSWTMSARAGPPWDSPSSQSTETADASAMAARVSTRGRRRLRLDRSCESVDRSIPASAAKSDRDCLVSATSSPSRSRKRFTNSVWLAMV